MKKMLLCALLLLLLAAGCGRAEEDVSANNFRKAQAIAVTDASGHVLKTITDSSAIEDFVDTLDVDHWALADLPKDASVVGSFGLSQEKTIHFGETQNDGKLYDVGTITLFDVPYLRAEVLGLSLDFEIPDAAHAALTSYLSETN